MQHLVYFPWVYDHKSTSCGVISPQDQIVVSRLEGDVKAYKEWQTYIKMAYLPQAPCKPVPLFPCLF